MQKPIMTNATILVVDDEELIRWSLNERLSQEGYEVIEAGTGREARRRLHARDRRRAARLPPAGFRRDAVLKQMKAVDADVLDHHAHRSSSGVETAVEAMKLGAHHFANKPFNLDEMSLIVGRRSRRRGCGARSSSCARTRRGPTRCAHRRGVGGRWRRCGRWWRSVAASPASTVLLTGESGTGKDLVAKVIHYSSDARSRSFMNITCSALPEQLLESELFGHERGAFTDARMQKRGLLESADGGTVFLDEIGEMVPGSRPSCCASSRRRAFKRVGGAADIHVDVRVVAATNRDLEEAGGQGRFRSDLYYRLNVLPIRLPRSASIPTTSRRWCTFFIDGFNREFKKRISGVSPAA
jgi:two-component system, NtrC family, response regulator AtoC